MNTLVPDTEEYPFAKSRSLKGMPVKWPLVVQVPKVLGGSWDLVSKVISTLIGVISKYKYSYPNYNPSY